MLPSLNYEWGWQQIIGPYGVVFVLLIIMWVFRRDTQASHKGFMEAQGKIVDMAKSMAEAYHEELVICQKRNDTFQQTLEKMQFENKLMWNKFVLKENEVTTLHNEGVSLLDQEIASGKSSDSKPIV